MQAFIGSIQLFGGETVAPGYLTLQTVTEGAEIWYTTNGNCPRDDLENRILYKEPIYLEPGEYYFRIRACRNGVYSEGLPLHLTVFAFDDVAETDWFYNAVYHCYGKGYFKGVSETLFAPRSTMTRAMFATVLYRIAGEPEVTGSSPFGDVPDGKWYTNPIIWASGEGIILGYGNGIFGREDPVTREQMVTLFWRYQNRPAAAEPDLSAFTDADMISGWAKEAFEWAVSVGVINGKGNGILDPKGTATRAEVAQIVMNFDTKVR